MAIRRELLLIIALILVIAALIKIIEFFQVNVVEADASKFVLEDLGGKYPDADIAVMTISPMTNANGARYFEVKARVTEGPQSPCPQRSHIFYNYPAQNFVPQPAEVITAGCEVCTSGICTIAFPEEAVIASHTFSGTKAISAYLLANSDAIPSAAENPATESWKVKWNSPSAMSYFVADIHRNGTVLGVKETQKQ